tara:strand:- start:11315 stop:11563 length:249 start_codon:yes stop_codon:yes gene_type:complete
MLGQPVWLLRVTMPRDEFMKWISYLNNKPPTIQEQQMAVLSTIVSNALGGKAKVKDFLVSKTPKQKVKNMTATDMREAFGLS